MNIEDFIPINKEEYDINQMSPLVWAYVGDCVYELYIRTNLVNNTKLNPHGLDTITDFNTVEMLILPGGLRGVASIRACRPVLDAVRQVAERGGWVAAICAAPTVLAQLGITDGRRATCYPGMEDKLLGANWQEQPVVVDGNFVTSRGVGTAIAFALTLVTILKDEETAKSLANSIVYKW